MTAYNGSKPIKHFALLVFSMASACALAFIFLPNNLSLITSPQESTFGASTNSANPASLTAKKSSEPSASNTKPTASILPIQLKAVFAGKNGSGSALLENGKIVKRYKQGDRLRLPGEVFLTAVYSDHILLSNNGFPQRYFLRFDAADLQQNTTDSASASSVIRSRLDVNEPAIRAIVGSKVKQRILSKPLSFARYVFVTPRFVSVNETSKTTSGYTLRPGPDKRLFAQSGLRAGDVLLAINKQDVGQLSRQQMMQLVAQSNDVELTFERDGIPHSTVITL